MIIQVRDPEDLRIADYMQIREAELVKRRGVFLAEGPEVVRTLILRSRFEARSVLLVERRVEAMQDALGALPEQTPVYVVSQAVMDRIVGFNFHRGVIAAGQLPARQSAQAMLEQARGPQLWVVLEALANHDNVGGILRSAAAFGASGVLLDSRCADPLYRRSIRVSIGAALRVPFGWYESGPALAQTMRHLGIMSYAMTPSGDEAALLALTRGAERPQKVALFLGTEGTGLLQETIAACDQALRIPMQLGMDSINVTTSAGIALFVMAFKKNYPA